MLIIRLKNWRCVFVVRKISVRMMVKYCLSVGEWVLVLGLIEVVMFMFMLLLIILVVIIGVVNESWRMKFRVRLISVLLVIVSRFVIDSSVGGVVIVV